MLQQRTHSDRGLGGGGGLQWPHLVEGGPLHQLEGSWVDISFLEVDGLRQLSLFQRLDLQGLIRVCSLDIHLLGEVRVHP